MNGKTVLKRSWKFRKEDYEEKVLITRTDNSLRKFVCGRGRDRAFAGT